MKPRWFLGPTALLVSVACAPATCPPCRAQEPAPCEPPSTIHPAPRPSAPPAASGTAETRTQAVIADVVARNRDKVRACYERERAKNPLLAGTLTVHFQLDPAGRVTEAHVVTERSTLLQPTLHECATAAIRSLTFPPSSRGFESQVNYPFDFKP